MPTALLVRSALRPPCRRLRLRRLVVALALGVAAGAEAAVDPTALSLEQLMEISVVGASKYRQRQAEVAAAVSVITREEIRAFGWRTLDAALASLPGIYRTYDRQYTYLGVRGYGLPGDFNTRVLVTIDGDRLNDPTYDAATIGREFPLDMDLVERIEYIPGPGGAVYGQNAMFGVVNVVTRTGASVAGTELRADYEHPRVTRDGRVTWGKRLQSGVDVLLSATGMRSRGEDHAMEFPGAGPGGETIAGPAAGMDGERDRELFARLASGPWSVGVVYGERRKHDPTSIYFSDPLAPGQYEQDRYVLAQARYARQLDHDIDLLGRLFVGRHRYESSFVFGGTRYASTTAGDWWGGELRLVWTGVRDHKLMLGFEGQDNRRTDQSFGDNLDDALRVLVPGSGYRLGAYLQDEWRIDDTLSTTLGLRADRDCHNGTALSPRAAVLWQATPATLVKALYGRAGRAPNAYERAWEDGVAQVANPDLAAERIDTLELVVDHRVTPELAVRGALYRWTMKDVITLGIDPASGLTQYQSGERVEASGVELSADRTWAWGGRLRASASFQDARRERGGRLPNSPRALAKLLFSAPWVAGLRAGYELAYESSRHTLAGERTPGHALANVHFVAEGWAPGLEVGLSATNLFGKRYWHPAADSNWQDALEQDGRAVRLRLLYRF